MGACTSSPIQHKCAQLSVAPAPLAGQRERGARTKVSAATPATLTAAAQTEASQRKSIDDSRCQRQQQEETATAAAAAAKDGSCQPASFPIVHPQPEVPTQDPAALHLEMLAELYEFQQQLALANANPLLGLQEAAKLVARRLRADLVTVRLFTGEPAAAVLMGAHGAAAAACSGRAVVAGREGEAMRRAAGTAVRVSDAAVGQLGEPLPRELQLFHSRHGLRSFTQVPIGPPAAPLGTLTLGKLRPGAFDDESIHVWLHSAAMGLLHHASHPQVSEMTCLLRAMDDAPEPLAAISVLLQGASRFASRATGLGARARAALLHSVDGEPEVLLLEAPRSAANGAAAAAASRRPQWDGDSMHGASVEGSLEGSFRDRGLWGLSGAAGAAPGSRAAAAAERAGRGGAPAWVPAPGADAVVSSIELDHTLLEAAIRKRDARFVEDCSKYLQSSPEPARDLFTRESDVVAAVAVVPLMARGRAVGGLYFTADAAYRLRHIKEELLAFVSGVQPVLMDKVDAHPGVIAALALKATHRREAYCPEGASLPSDSSSVSDSQSSLTFARGALPRSGSLPRGSSQRLNTEAMLQVLQAELRRGSRRKADPAYYGPVPELAVTDQIGHGATGVVFKGFWSRAQAAVKITYSRSDTREAMNDAVEMAVLSTAQHPNIVQVYACLTDMVEVGEAMLSSQCGSSGSLVAGTRFRRVRPEEDAGDAPTCNLMVMEYCDRGTLRAAAISGALASGGAATPAPAPAPAGGAAPPAFVDVVSCVEVLLDVACAVGYLHTMQLVHGDIKLDNILMKSDASRRLGMTPKLGGFGMAKILDCAGKAANLKAAAAAAHAAPETLSGGGSITAAVDAFSFGVLMCDLFASCQASAGPSRCAAAAPPEYSRLASDCRAADPAARPSFPEIAARLEGLLPQFGPAGLRRSTQAPCGGADAVRAWLKGIDGPYPAAAAVGW